MARKKKPANAKKAPAKKKSIQSDVTPPPDGRPLMDRLFSGWSKTSRPAKMTRDKL